MDRGESGGKFGRQLRVGHGTLTKVIRMVVVELEELIDFVGSQLICPGNWQS